MSGSRAKQQRRNLDRRRLAVDRSTVADLQEVVGWLLYEADLEQLADIRRLAMETSESFAARVIGMSAETKRVIIDRLASAVAFDLMTDSRAPLDGEMELPPCTTNAMTRELNQIHRELGFGEAVTP